MEKIQIEAFNLNAIQGKKVSIYGATIGGKVVYQQLKKMGVVVNHIYDKGRIGLKFCGQYVCDPEAIKSDEIVINVLTRSFNSTCDFLLKKKCKIYEFSEYVSQLNLSDLEYVEEEGEDILNFSLSIVNLL